MRHLLYTYPKEESKYIVRMSLGWMGEKNDSEMDHLILKGHGKWK